jgi:hemerythrin superfamily protein
MGKRSIDVGTDAKERSAVDAIMLLKDDHKRIEHLFKQFQRTGSRARVTRRRLVDRMIRELSIHAGIEEELFYPAVRHALDQTEDQVLESLEEHHLVKLMLSELEGTDPADERFEAKVTVLMENVRHHVREEEDEMFPKVRTGIDRTALRELGERMAEAKRYVPDRPHPHAPDEPPANQILGVGVGLMDRAKDLGAGVLRTITP